MGSPPTRWLNAYALLRPGAWITSWRLPSTPTSQPTRSVLAQGGSLATYATGDPEPSIPFWPLVFKNNRLFFLGSDDFPAQAKATAAAELNEALDREWPGLGIAERFSLNSIAEAHEWVESRRRSGRVVVTVTRS